MQRMNKGAFALPGTSLDFHSGNWRNEKPVYGARPAPCYHACPAGEPVRDYLALAAQQNFKAAWELLVQVNPLPAITGRVCHHPCEGSCNRNELDEAVAIHHVERHLGDLALQEDWNYSLSPPHLSERIAVVGAGPSGLAAAYHAVRLGFQVSLFDAAPCAGGLLRSAIPPYRLPRDVVDRELEKLLAIQGINFYPNHSLGRDIHLDELRQEFAATFLGIGTQVTLEWQIEGSQPDDLHNGLALLQECINVGEVPAWNKVAVVGAGNTAVDLARMLIRSGVKEVHVISHKAIPAAGVPTSDQMPALAREVQQALAEGVIIHEHQLVQRLILRGGLVIGLELVKAKKLDYDGTLKRTAFEGTETVLEVDQVIPAIGQQVANDGVESLLNGKHYIAADLFGCLPNHACLYVGGDARGDHGVVSEAIGDGRRALEHFYHQLNNARFVEKEEQPLKIDALNVHYFQPTPRINSDTQPVNKRVKSNLEIELGLTDSQARDESLRCLSCGECLQCDNCWNYCPDAAVLVVDETQQKRRYVIDYEYCKGCGLCAHECPSGYIQMQVET